MKRVMCLLIPLGLLAAPSSAALYMKSKMHGTAPSGRAADEVNMTFEGWFDDDRAVIEILESNNAAYRKGKIFIAGTTMTLYDAEENTCTPWDLQAMLRFAGAVMESMGGVFQFEFGEPEIEVLERGGGKIMLGRQVDYIRYRSDWTMSFKAPLVGKRTYDNSTVHELWYDKRLRDELPSFGLFMEPDSFTTGHQEMDDAIAASMPPVEGAVLKSIAVSTTTNQKGKEQTSTTTSEVTALDPSAGDPPGGYAPPADCRTVSTFPPVAAGEEGEGGEDDAPSAEAQESDSPWSKVKVKNPFQKKKKKDDG